MYARTTVVDWLLENLNDLEADGYVEGASTPKQQVVAHFRSFIRGDDMRLFMAPRLMRPN